jgi:hypothetical protein
MLTGSLSANACWRQASMGEPWYRQPQIFQRSRVSQLIQQYGMHRVWESFQAWLAFTMAAFNVLVQWHGFQPYASGFVPLSIAEFSL